MLKVRIVEALLAFVLGFCFMSMFLSFARAQQEPAIDPQTNGHTHDGGVGEFYQTWRQPPYRELSCCNRTDCRPILSMHKLGNGEFEIEVNDFGVPKWFRVPNKIWEDNNGDPRESPDGRGHACIMNGRVICAVRSSDQ